jgi:phage anti-repressor protein
MITLKDYLKKYSSINTEFINELFSLYDPDVDTGEFPINLNNVAKWLQTRPQSLKATLTRSYTKNTDYIIKKQKNASGQSIEIYMLSPSCFKKLIMCGKTKKSEDARSYFIEIENHIEHYMNHIIAGLNAKIRKLEKNKK